MLTNMKGLFRKIAYSFYPDTTQFEGLTLPPRHIRLGGAHFAEDKDFFHSGKTEAELVGKYLNSKGENQVLDLGCGVGRLAIGLMAVSSEVAPFQYTGVDVSEFSLNWCKKHLEPLFENYSFHLSSAHNSRYNPQGETKSSTGILPFADSHFDVLYHYSVFSHMLTEDIESYLAETHRLLKPGGHTVFTLFVEDQCPDVTENPEGYGPLEWKGALHCVRFNREFFESLVKQANLEIESFTHGQETDGQSRYVLKKS